MNKREKDRKQAKKTSLQEWSKKQSQGFEGQFVKLPEGMGFYKFKGEGKIELDFMPFIAGARNDNADEGAEHFEKTVVVHRVPTASGKNRPVLCRAHAFGKKCAACEWLRRNAGSADEELVKQVREKIRHLWLVNDKPGDAKNPLKILETTHNNRGQGFAELIGDAGALLDEGESAFDLDGGYTAVLTLKEMTQPSKYYAPVRIDFKKRKYSYPESMLGKNPCLDDLLIDPGYDDIAKLLETGGIEDDSDRKADKSSAGGDDDDKPNPGEEEDDGEPDGLEKWMKPGAYCTWKGKECKILDVKSSGLVLEDDNEDEHEGVPPARVKKVELADDEDSDDDGEEEAQEKKPSGKKRRDPDEEEDDSEDEDSDEDDSDDDEEEEEDVKPAARKRRK